MKIKYYYLIVISFILFTSCFNKKEPVVILKNYNEIPSYEKRIQNVKLTDSLLNLSITKGNEKAYNLVSSDFILDANYEGLIYYSLIMANKYNSPEAHFHIFLILSESADGGSFEKLDNKTKCLALYYLLKSKELGYENAKYSINEIFKKGRVLHKSNYYLLEYSK